MSCYKYDIIYRPARAGKIWPLTHCPECAPPLTNSPLNKLAELHHSLCHAGVARLVHWVRAKNLPYSVEEIKRMTADCQVCAEIKPRYAKTEGCLIKATAPFERLNVDFKGPIPSNTHNKYILTIIDEYIRFPFAFACKDMTSGTVIKYFTELFLLFGTPAL